ncbi:MAG TPA: N-acetyltransferase [bacterium]|nr:N-acetyltransferase [bacterium]HPQ67390.1 N-acetyltransferase [bacterium]
MKRPIPTKLRKSEYTFKVEWLEGLLQAPDRAPAMPPMYSPIKNREGKTFNVLIRPIKPEEVDPVLSFLRLTLDAEYDYYDIVGVRVYAELLAIKRKRMKDEYFFLGLNEGRLVGIANGRIRDPEVNISLHTLTFERQINAGAILFYSKCWYAFEVCKNDEFWATFESYNGWRLAGLRMALPSYPWPEEQHELGGAKIFYLTRELWEESIKEEYLEQVSRTAFLPADDDIIAANEKLIIPEALDI